MGIGDILVTGKRRVPLQPGRASTGRPRGRPPLDPEAKAFLEFAAALGNPPGYALPYDEARRSVRESSPQLSLPGPEMAAIDDFMVPGGEGQLGVRLFTPFDLAEPAPLLIFFHGGGFVYCDLDTHDGLCRSLAASGRCMVASVDYRLAPEYGFPAAPDDALAAAKWLIGHAPRLAVDARRIAVGGDSAGGNLAAGIAQAIPGLAGQLLLYPWLDMRLRQASHFRNGQGYMLTRASLLWFRSHYLSEPAQRTDPRASPILAGSLAGLPPTFILTAGYDPLRDEAVDYAARLSESGVAVHHSDHADQIHGFAMMNRIISAADTAVQEAGRWLTAIWRRPVGLVE